MNNVKKLKIYQRKNLDNIPQLKVLSKEELFNIKVVSNVLPFRVNNYVLEELIDWSRVPEDPIFQLTFMQKDMLGVNQFNRMADAISKNLTSSEIRAVADKIRRELNPHPAGQLTANVPFLDEEPVKGKHVLVNVHGKAIHHAGQVKSVAGCQVNPGGAGIGIFR